MPQRHLDDIGITGDAFGQLLVDYIMRFSGIKMLSLEDFLLPEDDVAIVQQLRKAESLHGTRTQRATAEKWPMMHERMFEEMGIDPFTPSKPLPEVFQLYPGLYSLTDREWDILKAESIQSFPEVNGRCVTVGKSLGRARCTEISQCLTGNPRAYLSGRCRLMHGKEALLLQGIHYGSSQHKLMKYDDAFLANLSGNAFQTVSCMQAMLATMTALAVAKYRHTVVQIHRAPSNSTVDFLWEDSREDDNLDFVWGG